MDLGKEHVGPGIHPAIVCYRRSLSGKLQISLRSIRTRSARISPTSKELAISLLCQLCAKFSVEPCVGLVRHGY